MAGMRDILHGPRADLAGESFPLHADPSSITRTAGETGATRAPGHPPLAAGQPRTASSRVPSPALASRPAGRQGAARHSFIGGSQRSPPAGRARYLPDSFPSLQGVPRSRAPSSPGLSKPAAVAQCPARRRKWERISYGRGRGACRLPARLPGARPPPGTRAPSCCPGSRAPTGMGVLRVLVRATWVRNAGERGGGFKRPRNTAVRSRAAECSLHLRLAVAPLPWGWHTQGTQRSCLRAPNGGARENRAWCGDAGVGGGLGAFCAGGVGLHRDVEPSCP